MKLNIEKLNVDANISSMEFMELFTKLLAFEGLKSKLKGRPLLEYLIESDLEDDEWRLFCAGFLGLAWNYHVMLITITLLLIQLSGWLEYRPLQKGEEALVIVRLEQSVNAEEIKASIIGAPEIMIETDAFRSVADNSIIWRISPRKETGKTELTIRIDDHEITKSVICSSLVEGVSRCRTKSNIKNQLLCPNEAVLKENSPVIDISVTYPLRIIKIGFFTINWIVAIFVLSIIFGLILMKPFKVKL